MYNKVMIIGNMGGEPKLKELSSGDVVCNVSIATNDKWVDKSGEKHESTEWHEVTAWGKNAENIVRYGFKGARVLIDGALRYRKYTTKEGSEIKLCEIRATRVCFLWNKSDKQDNQEKPQEPLVHRRPAPYDNTERPAPDVDGNTSGFPEDLFAKYR